MTELAKITAHLGQTEPAGPTSATIAKLQDDVATLTSTVQDLKDSQNALLEHVTAIARYVVAHIRPTPDAPTTSAAPTHRPTPLTPAQEKAFLTAHGRCLQCAWRLEKGKPHTCDAAAKARSVEAIRRESALRLLPRASSSPSHTFVFNGRIAGINTSVLFDGGATTSFVDESLVKRYGLSIRANPHEVRMANGSSVISPGTVYLHVTIQNYTGAVTLRVLPLVPGFGVVLGDDWARSHQLLVDHGSSALQQAPSLLLRSKRLRLFPKSSVPAASGPSSSECSFHSCQACTDLLCLISINQC
jgi:hypothetical protein